MADVVEEAKVTINIIMQKGGRNTTSKDIINEWKLLFNKDEVNTNNNDDINKCNIS